MDTRTNLGLSALPLLYPDAVQQDDYPPQFQLGGRFGTSPNIGSNNAPFYNFNTTYDFLGNLTKVWGRHTSKVGIYVQKSLKDQSGFAQPQRRHQLQRRRQPTRSTPATPPPTPRPACSTASRQASLYPIGEYRYWNIEWYAQDNWKVNDRLTLDYGLRFYWVQPQHDEAGLTSNFIPALFDAEPGRAAVSSGLMQRRRASAVDPVTGQVLPAVNIGRIVPNSGNLTNGIGQGGRSGVAGAPDRGQRHPVRAALRPDLRPHRQPVVHLPRRRRHLLRPLRGQHRVRR